MAEPLGFKLCCADLEGRENLVGEAGIGLESKSRQAGDDAVGRVKVLLACGTRGQMLAEGLFFLNGDFARERFVDQVADRLVTISLHVPLRPSVVAGPPGRGKFLTILSKPTPRQRD